MQGDKGAQSQKSLIFPSDLSDNGQVLAYTLLFEGLLAGSSGARWFISVGIASFMRGI